MLKDSNSNNVSYENRRRLDYLLNAYQSNYFQSYIRMINSEDIFSIQFDKDTEFNWWWNVDLRIDGLRKSLPKKLAESWEDTQFMRIQGERAHLFNGETLEDFIQMNNILEQIFEIFSINYQI